MRHGYDSYMMNQAKAFKGLGMEGFTARWYASLTRKRWMISRRLHCVSRSKFHPAAVCWK